MNSTKTDLDFMKELLVKIKLSALWVAIMLSYQQGDVLRFMEPYIALISLLGFIVVLAVMLIHAKRKVCPTCAIMDECHTAF